MDATFQLEGPDSDAVYVLNLGSRFNWLSRSSLTEFHKALDTLEASKGPACCILTGSGKFFSNGLHIEDLNKDAVGYLEEFHKVLYRLLSFPIPIIAAINGHAYAGGAMVALCCDFRIMNKNNGFLCINELDIGLPLTAGMWGVIRAKTNRSDWTKIVLETHRWTAEEGVTSGFINQACSADVLRQEAQAKAKALAKRAENRVIYQALKKRMYAEELRLLHSKISCAPHVTSYITSKL